MMNRRTFVPADDAHGVPMITTAEFEPFLTVSESPSGTEDPIIHRGMKFSERSAVVAPST
jgi:hypothetical protein